MLDEPAAGLNAAEVDFLLKRLENISKRGITVLVVEHNMDLVMNVAQRVFVMDHGVPLFEGTPREVQANPRVIEAYLGGEFAVIYCLGSKASSSPTARSRRARRLLRRRRRRDRDPDRRQRRRQEHHHARRGRRHAAAPRPDRVRRQGRDAPAGAPPRARRHRARARGPARVPRADRAREPRDGRLQVPQGPQEGRCPDRARHDDVPAPARARRAARPARSRAASSRCSRSRAP